MNNLTRALTCLPPGLALAIFAAACSYPSQARPSDRDPASWDPDQRQALSHYQAQLVELPLSVKSYDLTGRQRTTPVVVRELHLIQDNVRDEMLVIDADSGRHSMWSIDAHDFTLNWRTPIEQRVNYSPLATRNYIFLMARNGEYQAFDRVSAPREGESRLVSRGRFEGDMFPSAHPAANDSHLFVPSTNNNSVRGLSMLSNPRGQGAESWSYPSATGDSASDVFKQVSMRPAADRETVVFVNNNNRLYMVDAQNGEFRADPNLEAGSRTPPVIKDDIVFVGSDKAQLFAWQKSGEAAWVADTGGLPYGEIFVEDRWVFVRTLELYDREVSDGRNTRTQAALRPGKLLAFQYRLVDVPGDRPVFELVDGDPSTPHTREPMWSEPDVGQRVLMVNGNHVYVLYETKEEYLSEREKARLREAGRIVRAEDELRTTSRRLKVLDINTGKLARPEWDLDMMDFEFIVGSMQERDRALYMATRDGYVFKLHARNRGAAGGR